MEGNQSEGVRSIREVTFIPTTGVGERKEQEENILVQIEKGENEEMFTHKGQVFPGPRKKRIEERPGPAGYW